MRHDRKRVFALLNFLGILGLVGVGCSSKSVVHKDRIFIVPEGHAGYLAVVYGAKKNQTTIANDGVGKEVITIPPVGILCVGEVRPPTVVGIDEYHYGSANGTILPIGTPSETLRGPQVWWTRTGTYFPSHLGMRPIQSTSESGAVHYETFYVSLDGAPVAPSEAEKRAFKEQMSQHCGF